MTAQAFAQAWSLISRWYSIPLLLLVWQVAVASGLVESRLLPNPLRARKLAMGRSSITQA